MLTQWGWVWKSVAKCGCGAVAVTEAGTNLAASGAKLGLFASQFTHTLDGKKRIAIPAVWRELIGEPPQVFVMPTMNLPAISVLPLKEMAARLERARQASIANQKAQLFLRYIAANSEVLEWDVQGRIRIKDDLLARAKIRDEVVLVGHVDHFEIWCPEEWQKKQAEFNEKDIQEGAISVGW